MEDEKTNEISDGRDRSPDLRGTVKQELFRVVIVNDDSTPMEFVVRALIESFQKTQEDAERIMLMTHHTGRGTCGVYSRTEAESLVKQITVRAGQGGYPLQCLIEPHSLKEPPACELPPASKPHCYCLIPDVSGNAFLAVPAREGLWTLPTVEHDGRYGMSAPCQLSAGERPRLLRSSLSELSPAP